MFQLEQQVQPGLDEQKSPIAEGFKTQQSLIEEARKEQAQISIVASSGSHQTSTTTRDDEGIFTKKLLNNLRSGKPFYRAVNALVGNNVAKEYNRNQVPVVSGESLAEDFLTDKMEGPKTLIHIEGQLAKGEQGNAFFKDNEKVSNLFKAKEFQAIGVESLSEFKAAVRHVIKNADKDNKETLTIYYSGHMGMLKPPSASGLASNSLPQLDHTPSSEGVFVFKGDDKIKNFESAEYVHEAAFMNEIREVRDSGKFKNIIIIVDACFAGSIDSEQYLKGEKKEVPKVDEGKLETNKFYR